MKTSSGLSFQKLTSSGTVARLTNGYIPSEKNWRLIISKLCFKSGLKITTVSERSRQSFVLNNDKLNLGKQKLSTFESISKSEKEIKC